MIADWDTDILQSHRKGIGARGVTEPILTLESLGATKPELEFCQRDSFYIFYIVRKQTYKLELLTK